LAQASMLASRIRRQTSNGSNDFGSLLSLILHSLPVPRLFRRAALNLQSSGRARSPLMSRQGFRCRKRLDCQAVWQRGMTVARRQRSFSDLVQRVWLALPMRDTTNPTPLDGVDAGLGERARQRLAAKLTEARSNRGPHGFHSRSRDQPLP
jgi:hypothetical protein